MAMSSSVCFVRLQDKEAAKALQTVAIITPRNAVHWRQVPVWAFFVMCSTAQETLAGYPSRQQMPVLRRIQCRWLMQPVFRLL
jgi:hypothetical protein